MSTDELRAMLREQEFNFFRAVSTKTEDLEKIEGVIEVGLGHQGDGAGKAHDYVIHVVLDREPARLTKAIPPEVTVNFHGEEIAVPVQWEIGSCPVG